MLKSFTEMARYVMLHRGPESDAGVAWDDPALGIDWPVAPGDALVSRKDALLPPLAELPTVFA